MIGVLDYGLGNVRAFLNVFKRLNVAAVPARTAADVRAASRLLLPGVGAFDHAMNLLNESGIRDELETVVVERGVPLLGVCVGMQILGDASEEGQCDGLGWISGRVRAFASLGQRNLVLPHMGWNDVAPKTGGGLFAGLDEGAQFYFLHSYFFECRDAGHASATTSYGVPFSSGICVGNIYGVQFHPEKSHRWGVRLLKNFAEL